jgi:hypothetical protein
MKEKVIVCDAINAVRELQQYLDGGWKVKFCVSENITSTDSSQPGTYAAQGLVVRTGKIVFILHV